MSGADLKAIRRKISEAVGDRLSYLDMAALCGLSDPAGNGKDTYRKWEDGDGPSGPVAAFLSVIVEGLEHEDDAVSGFFERIVEDRVGIIHF
jgi:hypothetical protein